MNHDLDAFDDWFGSLDQNHSVDDGDDSPRQSHLRKKAIVGIVDEAIRIHDGVDDFSDCDSSDDDSKKRSRQSPQRGMMTRRQSGALEQILSAPLPIRSKQQPPAKSKSGDKTTNIAIKLLKDQDKERAKKVLAAREDSQRRNVVRRQYL